MNAAETGGATGGSVTTPAVTTTPVASPAPATGTFSAEYVRELREEAKAHRLTAQEQTALAKTAQEAAVKATADAEALIATSKLAADEKLLRAELKAIALKAGIVDLDGLKLADVSKLKLNEQGELEKGEEFITELKAAKPYLFGTVGATTSTTKGKPAASASNTPVDVSAMTSEQYRAYKKSLGITT